MNEQIIQRAELLVQHRRYQDAINELLKVLGTEPNHPDALSLMAICSIELNKLEDATRYVKQAMAINPDEPYLLYLMGLIHTKQDKLNEAAKFVLSAISFDPHNADYFGLLAAIKLDQKLWQDALTYANRGLQVDPENLTCLNVRSTALLKLDRKEESYETIKEALQSNPENSYTHANLGWGLLEKGDHVRALESFREALKLDPTNEHAKAGMVEALKARYWFYRVFLKYVFWMSSKSSKYQWMIIIGLWLGVRILNSVAESNPSIAPFAKPVVYLYAIFAISTWITQPLSNFFLRLNKYGRYALTSDQLKASTFTGVGFVIMLLGVAGVILVGEPLVVVIAYGVAIMMICGTMFKPTVKSKRAIAMTLAGIIILIGTLAMLLTLTGGNGFGVFLMFLYATIAYGFIINALL